MARKKATEPKTKTVKVSLTLPALLQWRLTMLAARLGRDRSDFAAELLDAGLSRYQFDKDLRKLAPPEIREETAALRVVAPTGTEGQGGQRDTD